ncbi:MAG: 2-hydroxyacyl-CoA dehydratase [Chloroflexi bacterium]|nr:2-hydroxyacyl-CoA dehydratase [Chloroflexota bacterium]
MENAKPKIGWLCAFAPEEIAMAAGLFPMRLSGGGESAAVADAYIYSNLCPYVKSILALGLNGETKHLDGLVFVRSCDGMHRLYDVWRSYVGTRFAYMLEVPKNQDEAAVEYFAGQLRKFARALEQEFGKEITLESLNKAIKTTNQMRTQMQHIYQLQRKLPLPLSGSEVFQLGLEGLSMDKKSFIAKLKKYYSDARSLAKQRGKESKARVLVSGNVIDRPDLFNIIEAAGADVAAADLCTALRYFGHLVDEDSGDPYLALAHGYLSKLRCARMTGLNERLTEIRELVDAYAVDGVVYTSVKFCDQHLADAPYFVEKLKDEGVAVLFLENDYTWGTRGQLTTRVEAFVEMLDSRRR